MLEMNLIVAFGAGLLAGILLTILLGWARQRTAREIAAEMQGERIRDLENVIERLRDSFAAVSYEALTKNTEQFLTLANERLKSQSQQGEQNLETKKQLIDKNLETMTKELTKVQEVMQQLEKDRELKFGELSTHLKSAAEQTAKLQETTDNLRSALANTKTRGQWGERMAEDVLRMAGFVEGINYRKQQTSGSGSRPDFTFLLPKDLIVNMDVKFPLDNYLQFLQAEEPVGRERFKQQFLRDVKQRIKEVTTREYINPEENTLDYVLVFIPNEQIYAFITENDGGIIDEAMRNRVVLCSPLTLYAFLAIIRKAVEVFHMEQTVAQVIQLMEVFHREWRKFGDSFAKMGRKIDEARDEFEALSTTRRTALERPILKIETLRRERNLPLESFAEEERDQEE